MSEDTLSLTRRYIDLGRLRANYRIISEMAPRSEKMCVVKADAYGHGAVECARTLYDEGCRHFAVSQLPEAMQLRKALGDGCELFILGSAPPEYAGCLADCSVTQALYSLDYAKCLSRELSGRGKRLKAHIKIDTGMNRIGFRADDEGLSEAVEAASLPGLEIEGAFSHFARADETDRSETLRQKEKFDRFIDGLRASGVAVPVRHISASSGMINFPEFNYELVRPGVILYGMQPSDTMKPVKALGLLPVMSLESRITHLHTVRAGEGVSYGGTFVPDRDITAATIPIGYGDGFLRAYSGMTVELGGEKRPIIGRICMDQCMADATGLDVKLFDRVGIFTDTNPIEDFAGKAGTITYECSCIISPRVPRSFVGN